MSKLHTLSITRLEKSIKLIYGATPSARSNKSKSITLKWSIGNDAPFYFGFDF